MIRWLKGQSKQRPQRIDTPPQDTTDTGRGAHVEPDFAAGSIIVQRGDRLYSLVWSEKDKDRRRALPAGEYRLRTTRLEGRQGDTWWFLSSTGPAIKKIRISRGSPNKLAIDGTVHFRARANRKGQLGFSIAGADQRGISIYREGRRVPVTYRVLDKKGKVIAKGPMNYG